MGTDFRIVLYASDSSVAANAAESAFARIAELDRKLSIYRDESELNRLSATSGSGRRVPVSESLFELLRKAESVSQESGGAFDITVGPFVDLWQQSRRTGRLADEAELVSAAAAVGWRLVELSPDGQIVRLLAEGMKLDSGGIGKGYAADEALKLLGRYGIGSALVDAGGDIAVSGPPPGREGWEILIPPLDGVPGQDSSLKLTLSGEAVATSGDLYQFVEIDGRRFAHIVDPATGLGVPHRQDVTVIAADALTADAWATALFVLGPERAASVLEERPEIDYRIRRYQEDGIRTWSSKSFGERVSDVPELPDS